MTERRTRTRRRILKSAQVRLEQGKVVDCFIRNISIEAACLEFNGPVGVPKTFELVLDSEGSVRHCRVAWQTRRHVGVAFVQ